MTPVQRYGLVGLFVIAAGFNLWGVLFGWRHATFQGNEFRQTHTAVSAFHIQRDRDFSLAYPTPVMGKPWSVPSEFPLYQWTVVLVSDTTNLPLQESGRLVSILCFYLSLPAVYLVLRWLGLRPSRCLASLSVILACPLYVLYSRAFLIETMALMFSTWYAAAFFRGSADRKGWWLIIANFAGIGAGLVKVTTFLVFLAPAFVWSLWLLWQAWPRSNPDNWRPLRKTFGWLAAAHAVPFAFTLWWIRFADEIKTLNPTGYYLRSDQLLDWNFGFGQRFAPENWRLIWLTFSEQIVWPPVLILAAIAGLLFVRQRLLVTALLFCIYVATLIVFPVLYAVHAYYHVAAAFLPLVGIGLLVTGIFESPRLPRVAGPVLLAILLMGQIWAYAKYTYPMYNRGGNRGSLAEALQDVLRSDECLIIAGDDWSPILPYYSQRRALLIRASLSRDSAYLSSAFAAMRGEDIGALVLFDHERENTPLLELAVREFGIDPEPLMFWDDRGRNAAVYFNRWFIPEVITRFHENENRYYKLTLASRPTPPDLLVGREVDYKALPRRYQNLFAGISPRPTRFFSTYSLKRWEAVQGEWRFFTHPVVRLWFDLPSGWHKLQTNISVPPPTWQNLIAADATDGIEVTASATFPDGRRAILHKRVINPTAHPEDREIVPIKWDFDLPLGARLEFSITAGPAGSIQRDWASIGDLTID